MLSNAYFLAKFRFDTAENEPAKNLQNFANLPILLTLTLRVSKFESESRTAVAHDEVPNLFSAEDKGGIAEDCRKDAKAAKKDGNGSPKSSPAEIQLFNGENNLAILTKKLRLENGAKECIM